MPIWHSFVSNTSTCPQYTSDCKINIFHWTNASLVANSSLDCPCRAPVFLSGFLVQTFPGQTAFPANESSLTFFQRSFLYFCCCQSVIKLQQIWHLFLIQHSIGQLVAGANNFPSITYSDTFWCLLSGRHDNQLSQLSVFPFSMFCVSNNSFMSFNLFV